MVNPINCTNMTIMYINKQPRLGEQQKYSGNKKLTRKCSFQNLDL